MDKYLKLTKNLINEFDKSASDYLNINVSDYSLTLKKGSAFVNHNSSLSSEISDVYTPAERKKVLNTAERNKECKCSQRSDTFSGSESPDVCGNTEEKITLEKVHEIKSPIVGVFYEAKDPAAEAFVKVGDSVKKGDVLCILESMKMMNEIRSDCDGIVKEIKCKNEELVEFGQSLFILEKN